MKKLLLIFVLMLAMAGFTKAQVVADFESGTSPFVMHSMANGHLDADTTNFAVVDNPVAFGVNTSTKVVKFTRAFDGNPWAGFWTALNDSIDVTTNKFMHVKVLKTRISPLHFKLEGGPAGNSEIASMYAQTVTNGWEDIVFDFRAKTGKYKVISFMPDFEDPLTLTEDIVMYFDDIVLNNDSVPAPLPTMNTATFNVNMWYWKHVGKFDPATQFVDVAGSFNAWDGTNFHLIPDAADSIYSITVDSLTIGGTLNFKFRINGSWADSLSEFPGGGPNRAFVVGYGINNLSVWFNDESAYAPVTFNVNMSCWKQLGKFDPATQFVDVAGSFDAWDGTNFHLTPDANDSIYSITIPDLMVGDTLNFKFRINGSWADSLSEFPGGGPNRQYIVIVGANVFSCWFNDDVTGIPENQLANKVQVYPNPFSANLFINTTTEINQIIISNYIGQQVARFENLKLGLMSVNTSDLKKGMYLVTFFAKDGSKYTQKLIKD